MNRNSIKTAVVVSILSCVVIASVRGKQSVSIDEPPAVVRAVAPFYSPLAIAGRAGGDVIAKVEVDAKGKVTWVEIKSGHQMLHGSVKDAASRWQFAPSEKEVRTATLTFEFDRVSKSHSNYRPEELTPVFVPPYKVIVVRDMSGKYQ